MVLSIFINQSSQFVKTNISPVDLTKNFDPCQPSSGSCFCKNHDAEPPVNFGDVILMGRSLEDFKQWAKNPNTKIKFWLIKDCA